MRQSKHDRVIVTNVLRQLLIIVCEQSQVENGKNVGFRIGDEVVYFNDLPASWETSDTVVAEAIDLGFGIGAQSAKADTLVSYLDTTHRELVEGLSDAIATAQNELAESLVETVAKSAECTASGRGIDATGSCVGLPWVVATDVRTACTRAESGALRHVAEVGGLQVCTDSKWMQVQAHDFGR
jgi:hypothetical protein